jgi:hypothetical protein
MLFTVFLLFIAAAARGTFAFWGQYTVAGRTQYDEMDGLYPLGAGLPAGLMVIAALGVAWLARRQQAPR